MKKKFFVLVSLFSLSVLAAYAESIKVTTFFPSPKGVYRRLETSGATLLATVGIGTTTPDPDPAVKLNVRGQVKITDGTEGIGKILVSGDAYGQAYWRGGPWVSDVTGAGTGSYLAKWTGANTVGPSSVFYVDHPNYRFVHVGIGTTNPQSTLSIGGSGSVVYSIYAQEDRPGGYAIYGQSTHASRGHGLYGDATNGNSVANPRDSYGVYATGTLYGAYGKATAADGVGAYGIAPYDAVKGTGEVGVYGESSTATGIGVFGKNDTGYGVYCEGGKCGGTRAFSSTSDIRLKTNIEPIPNALEKVRKLRGVTFEWKDQPGKREMGFIAQEVLPVLPEVIEKDPKGYYAMKQAEITAVLIEAAKEQQKQIDVLQKEVNDLQRS